MEFRASKLSVCIVNNPSDADARNTKPALAEPLWGRFGLLGELLGRSGGTPKAAGVSLEALWEASQGPERDPGNSEGGSRPAKCGVCIVNNTSNADAWNPDLALLVAA